MKPGQSAKKSETTKARIVDAAMELFAERGYDATTMRLIAEHAGVSVGNAYHYFSSKDELMQGYYGRIFDLFMVEAQPLLARSGSFNERMTAVLLAWVGVARPYHQFAGGYFRYAAEPTSALSPFSSESAPVREAMVAMFAQVVDGAEKLRMAPEVRARLPELLWMQLMGTVLYWVHDRSPGQRNTEVLIERTVPLVGRLINLSRLPVLRGTAADIIDLINTLAPKGISAGATA